MAHKRSIKEFIAAIIEVERKFGMSLSHEDSQGAFIVEDFSHKNAEWLRAAHNHTGEVDIDSPAPNADRPRRDWRGQ